MRRLITLFTFTLFAGVMVFNSCATQGPVKQAVVEELLKKADSSKNEGDYTTAFDYYTKALKLNPRIASAYYNRGIIWGINGDYDQAISDFTEALKIAPRIPMAYYYRGVAWGKKNDSDRAVIDYTKALEIDPQIPLAYHNRGIILYDKGDYNRACSDFQKACDLGHCDGLTSAKENHACK